MFVSSRRGLKFFDFVLVTIVGTIAGTYVWMPVVKKNQQQKLEAEKQQTTEEPK